MEDPVWKRIGEIVGPGKLNELKKRQKELHDMIDWSVVDPESLSDIENHYNLINWDALKKEEGDEKYKNLEKKFLNFTLTNAEYNLINRYTYASLLPNARWSQDPELFNGNSVGTESINNSNNSNNSKIFGNMNGNMNGGRRRKSKKSRKSKKNRKTNRNAK